MFPGISLMSFSDPFLITPNAPMTTGIIINIIIYLNYLRLIRCTLPGQLLPWEQATTSS